MKNIDNNIENILKIEGVNAQGYGIIPQAVMFDKDLPASSKGIYAYLVSYKGNSNSIYPKRDTIIKDLNMSKNAYYKYLKPLIDNGYIKIKKAKGFLNKNVYEICENTKKVKNNSSVSIFSLDGINGNGYGLVPKLIMKDTHINIKAKALIALFYSIAQNKYRVFPHIDTICTALGISKNVYYAALKQLIKCNYITVNQRRSAKTGKFVTNDYLLNANPNLNNDDNDTVNVYEEKKPHIENKDNVINSGIRVLQEKGDNVKNAIKTGVKLIQEKGDSVKSMLNTEITPIIEKEDNVEIYHTIKNNTMPHPENSDNNNITSNNSSSMILSSIQKLMYRQNQKDDEIKEMIYNLTYIWKYQSTDCKLYRKIVQALIDMLCVQGSAVYNKQTVKTSTLFEYLNDCLEQDTFGLSLRDLILGVYEHYCLLRDKFTIKKPYEYIKSLLFDHIKNFELV